MPLIGKGSSVFCSTWRGGGDPTAEALVLVDEWIAEIFDGATAVQELFGYQRNLAAAVSTMIQLSVGTYPHSEGSDAALGRMSSLMDRYHLPETQSILINRVARALVGINPLTKGGKDEERDAFTTLMRDLVGNRIMGDNGALAESLTLRAKSLFTEEFADENSEKAIADVIGLLPTTALKFGHLLDLCGTDFGTENEEHIVKWMARIVESMTSAEDLVEKGADQIQIVHAAAGIRDRLLSTALPDQWRLRFARNIYDLLLADNSEGAAEAGTPKKATAPAGAGNEAVKRTNGAEQRSKSETSQVTDKSRSSLGKVMIPAGDYFFREGEAGENAYLIMAGEVEVIRKIGDQEVVIAQVGEGGIVGEMSLVDAKPRSASARAISETEVIVISMDDMKMRLERLAKFDPILRELMGIFVQRMRNNELHPS